VPALCDAQETLQEATWNRRKEGLAVEKGINEVLAWAKVHRPKNTRRAYQPKLREWKVSVPAPFNFFLFFYIALLLIYYMFTGVVWDNGLRPGGEYLPFDWVDEGKLLLFVKTQVAERVPRKGKRLAAEKKRKLEKEAEDSKKKKRMRQEAETIEGAEEATEESPNTGEEEPKSELLLMYNSVHDYVSAIMELWSHQVSEKLHSSPLPHNVAVKALKTSIARGSIKEQRGRRIRS
jgi:hypothetical protein